MPLHYPMLMYTHRGVGIRTRETDKSQDRGPQGCFRYSQQRGPPSQCPGPVLCWRFNEEGHIRNSLHCPLPPMQQRVQNMLSPYSTAWLMLYCEAIGLFLGQPVLHLLLFAHYAYKCRLFALLQCSFLFFFIILDMFQTGTTIVLYLLLKHSCASLSKKNKLNLNKLLMVNSCGVKLKLHTLPVLFKISL